MHLPDFLRHDWLFLSAGGVLLLLGLVVGVYLVAGLFGARSLLRREFRAYFVSPVAYVMLVVFLAVVGYRFLLTLDQLTKTGPHGVEYPMQYLFSLLPRGSEGSAGSSAGFLEELLSGMAFWLVYLLIPPLLTMRLFAEERSTGTLEVLMTAPVRDWQVVLSKYLACLAFYLILWVPTLVYLPVLLNMGWPVVAPVWTVWSLLLVGGLVAVALAVVSALLPLGTGGRLVGLLLLLGGAAAAAVGGWAHYHLDQGEHLLEVPTGIDPMPVVSSYLGLALAGAMFLALGILVSSLVRDQLVAALVTAVLSLGFILTGFWRPDADGGGVSRVLTTFSVPLHFTQDFGRGVIDTRHLVLYGSVTLFCLFLTVRSLESRRWR
jgi:ABC-type transport system involved in multi-copper enzyme maturation permease subunit